MTTTKTIDIDWAGFCAQHLTPTLAELQDAASRRQDHEVRDLVEEARWLCATEEQIATAIANGEEMAREWDRAYANRVRA